MASRFAIGIMSGTSMDGVDAALAQIEGRGLEMQVSFRKHASAPLPRTDDLRRLASGEPMSAATIADLAHVVGEASATAAAATLSYGRTPDLVAVHGQTVLHDPPRSWQLLDPSPVATAFRRSRIVYDLRAADLAAGGRGAPITPLADWILFRAAGMRRAIVNLGGFCNVTILPDAEDPEGIKNIRGFDVCVCNQLLDAIAREVLGAPFDDRGACAASGRVDRRAFHTLRDVLERQRADGRALGTGDEGTAWIEATRDLAGADRAATAARGIGETIAASLGDVDEILVAGGGAMHDPLLDFIEQASGAEVLATDEFGIPAEAREALAMAVLGALCEDGLPITLPAVTGVPAPAPRAGRWLEPPAGKPVS